MRALARSLATLALLVALPNALGADPAPEGLLGGAYPVEVVASEPAALLHWLDSLAALSGASLTAGKTVEAHRIEFVERLGEPTPEDIRHLESFAEARKHTARRRGYAGTDPLTSAFFEEATVGAAALRATTALAEPHRRRFADAVEHFRARFRPIWRDGRVVQRFLARTERHARRSEVGAFLGEVARFYGAAERPAPLLIFVPVPDGHGTHAQAIGRFLLVEVRPGDDLEEQVAPIVHENAHYLFENIPAPRRNALHATVARSRGRGDTWELLHEALPTAIAQGVAAWRFTGERFSLERGWYHRPGVDRFAKRLFPLVRKTLAEGGTLDERFLERAAALNP